MESISINKMEDIWSLLCEQFNEKVPRRTAILVKPEDHALEYCYPAEFSDVGYFLDSRRNTTYDEIPTFRIKFLNVIYPSVYGQYNSRINFYWEKQLYYPSLIKRNIVYSSDGLEAEEFFGNVVDGAFTWRIIFKNCSFGKLEKLLFLVISAKRFDRISVEGENTVFKLEMEENRLFLKTVPFSWGTYDSVEEYSSEISKGKLNNKISGNKYLVLCYKTNIEPNASQNLQIGISTKEVEKAIQAFNIEDIETPIKSRWNMWFNRLPKLKFRNTDEKKAYYKCWWIIRLNYYNHPEHGHTVLEALPVYRGYWLWSLSPVGWYSSQDPDHPAENIKKLIDMFLKYQREDGYVTHAIYLTEKNPGESWSKSNLTQTPNISWAALQYYYVTRDETSLKKWYPGLVKFYNYLCETRDKKIRNLHLWAVLSSFDTGLDTNPVFQKVTYGIDGEKERYCYPAIYAAERYRYEISLAKIAHIIGDKSYKTWLKEAERTKNAIDKYLWDRTKKWYGVLHENGELDTRVGVDGLFPFAYNVADKDKANEAMKNFEKLIGEYGIYTFAPEEPGFCEEIYWRGPRWPVSCFLGMAVSLNYYPAFIERIVQGMIKSILIYPSIWECMSARTGKICRGDAGMMATPCISSNVGAAGFIGAILTSHGINMLSIDNELPLVEIKNFHWAGMWLDITKKGKHYQILAKEAEEKKGTISFKKYNKTIRTSVLINKVSRI